MESSLKYEELMPLLSQCQIGVALISDDNRILHINDTGNSLLHGKGKLTGQPVTDTLKELLHNPRKGYYVYVAFGEYIKWHPVPMPSDLPEGAIWIGFRDARLEYRAEMMEAVLGKITEGIVACDSREQLSYYNAAAAKTDSVAVETILGKKVDEVYTMTDGTEVVLPRVMKQRSPFLNFRQKYTTIDGKKKDVVANAWPVIVQGRILGAFNVVEDWSKVDELHKQIIDLQEKLVKYSSKTDKKSVLTARYTFDDILHHCQAMRLVVEQCRQVARTDSSVMIYGETGTGKELFAQSIHNASKRANGPFLAINCAALPENLLESLLFGSVKGAYTGAENRMGLFEQANHGTLLLDEINSMNINLQAKLLRVLQEGHIRKIGGSKEIPVYVRVLSNINVPPYEAIASNHLRQDLFYRLGAVNINIPPLRERTEDIPGIIEYFIAENNRKLSRNIRGMDQETLRIFENYRWPGNVRELQHAVEHAMIILPDYATDITKDYIPGHILEGTNDTPAAGKLSVPNAESENLNRHLKELEEDIIYRVLRENNGNITKSAKVLNMSRQNLQYRIKRYHIDIDKIKNS